jgi:hypothetical protein
MRRRLIGLVALAALAACSDSSPTRTTAPALNHRVRSTIVSGSLDDNINDLIDLWGQGQSTDFHNQWNHIKEYYQQGQTDPNKLRQAQKAVQALAQLVVKQSGKMQDDPPGGESPQAAASRLALYMLLYVFGGPNTSPPPYFPGADNAVGFLTPSRGLTLVTPSGDAGAQFDKGSTNVDRIIVIVQNPEPWGTCEGPLDTTLCQYPLYYDIMSFPDTKLLKQAKAAVCHPAVGEPYGPPDSYTHGWLRLAHNKPASPSDYTAGGTIYEGIEILPLITQTFLTCVDVEYDPPPGDFYEEFGALNRGMRSIVHLASRVGKWLLPKSAFAIDQGGGGGFEIFSPFNNVDASPVFDND